MKEKVEILELDRFIQFCQSENGQTGLAVDRDGILWRGERQRQEASVQEAVAQKESKAKEKQEIPEISWHWKRFDFNKEYQGYYPPCRFTAVAWTGGGFLATGTEAGAKEGKEAGSFRPVAYSSLRGGVWQPENLTARIPEGIVAPTEPVYDICTDQASGQIFLLGGRGQVITLTGCPKCVKLSHFTDQDIRKGEIITKTIENLTAKTKETKEANEEKVLQLTLADGTTAEFPLHAALQLHLSREAAEEKRRQGGIFVYVGDGNGSEAVGGARKVGVSSVKVSGMLVCPLPKLKRFFEAWPKEQILVFFCETGVKAEAAAKSARVQGYQQAYYAGEGE